MSAFCVVGLFNTDCVLYCSRSLCILCCGCALDVWACVHSVLWSCFMLCVGFFCCRFVVCCVASLSLSVFDVGVVGYIGVLWWAVLRSFLGLFDVGASFGFRPFCCFSIVTGKQTKK